MAQTVSPMGRGIGYDLLEELYGLITKEH